MWQLKGKLTPGWMGENAECILEVQSEEESKVTGVLAQEAGKMELLCVSVRWRRL